VTGKASSPVDFSRMGYWELVWRQFRKKKMAMCGLYIICALLALAIFAPVFIGNRPYYVKVGEGPWMFPWFRSLFDTLYYECTVDIVFNLVMVLFPIFVCLFFINRRWLHLKAKQFIDICVVLLFGGVGLVMYFAYSEPYIDYKEFIRDKQSQSLQVSYCLPPIPYSYKETNMRGAPPHPPCAKYPLGTDCLGRDVLSRMVFGLRIALSVGVVAVSIYVTIGIILGALAGYFMGKVDLLISRFIEIMLCFPFLFFILTIAAMIENRSIYHVMIIIGVTSWPSVARLIRAEFLKQREMDYVQAAISQGIQKRQIVFSHILPNAISPVLVSATFGIASAILAESTLSFLNVGDTNVSSWGELLNMGRQQLQSWWLIMIPGFAIFMMVALFNLVGDGLRDSLDPKLRE
jgi:peptide/nickel transport system permease protein